MFEDLEGLNSVSKDSIKLSDISPNELEYIRECVAPPRPDALIERIDEIQGHEPPRAIDSNSEIAEVIEPIRDQIPSTFLEASSDLEQVDQISDVLRDTAGLELEEWKELSLEQRVELLNELEGKIAQIEHRPACPIEVEDLGKIIERDGGVEGSMGYHQNDFMGERIVINENLVNSDNPVCLDEVLDTLVHEGRHSYQTYNMEVRENHTSQGDLTNWHKNMEEYGYQDPQTWGFKSYWLQPIEADARKFAEDVLTAYKEKL